MTRAVLLAVAFAALAFAAPAQAGVLSPEDAAELAQTLAEAQEDQDVCYGWNVTNNFSASSDVGSSTSGPGVALVPTQAACPKGAVILQGDIDYSCGSCESSDSASISISAGNLSNPPTVDDLEGLGLKAGALTGDDDDTTLVNMVNALPLLVADRGNAPYVEYEQATTVPAADHPTGTPGSDLLRDSWLGLLFFGGLVLAGPGLFFYKRSQRPSGTSRRRRRPAPPEPAPAGGPEPEPGQRPEVADEGPQVAQQPDPARRRQAEPATPQHDPPAATDEPYQPSSSPAAPAPDPPGDADEPYWPPPSQPPPAT